MTDGDKKAFATLIDDLAEVFPADVGKSKKAKYFEAMNEAGVSLAQLGYAVKRMIRERKVPFFPVPAEIIEVARLMPSRTASDTPAKVIVMEDRTEVRWRQMLDDLKQKMGIAS